jgi:hypothetical protein
MDFSHLDALESRLNREQARLAQAKSAGLESEVAFREVQVASCQREIAKEREFLGLGEPAEISDEELAAELGTWT